MPAIYKPTRITETTATIIDTILKNNENKIKSSNQIIIKSSTLVIDINDYFPTTLSTNIDHVYSNISGNGKRVTHKRNHSYDNITKFKQKLSEVNWFEILDGNNADVDYNKFIETFGNIYYDCIVLIDDCQLKHFVPTSILHILYCTLVLPYLNYGILIWGDTCKSYLNKLMKLQKWAIRTVSNNHYRSHTGPIFAKYNVWQLLICILWNWARSCTETLWMSYLLHLIIILLNDLKFTTIWQDMVTI